MSENQIWHPLVTMVGLLTCAIPVKLKAGILHVLTAFAKTPHIASALWQSMEMAQVIC
jgi:nuclear pore complex protein Nup205